MSTTVDNFIIKTTFPFLEGKDSAWAGGGGGFYKNRHVAKLPFSREIL